MELLEREDDLRQLAAALGHASVGEGRVALISGEAGIGKTSFVDCFTATHGRAWRVLKGHCDAFSTPSPLGPLYDIAPQLADGVIGGSLQAQLEGDGPRAAIFPAVLDALRQCQQPTLLVIEDIHWADEATFDLIKFLCRRIDRARVLLLLTYCDEVSALHPLRLLLGHLATSRSILRIELARLTAEAVARLAAGQPVDPVELHRQTAGNPFFVAEVLSSAGRGLPRTVRDAVLARVAQLRPAARRALEGAAVIGNRADHGMLVRMLGDEAEGLADCVAAGLLESAEPGIAFRHELVRAAVLAELDPLRRRELHRLALADLRAAGTARGDLAQLAHFAEGAGDGAAVLEFGLAAAEAAIVAGTHRAAVAHYRSVLSHVGDRVPAERARLAEAYAKQCSIVDELAEAVRARREAVELWRKAGDRRREGASLAELAWPLVRSGQNAAAEEASRRAIEVLESMPPSRELAAAYRIQGHLRMLDRDRTAAVQWGRKAIALATRLGDDGIVAASEIVIGAAMLVAGDKRGLPHFDRSLALAEKAGLDDLVGLAHSNLGSAYGEQYQFAAAEHHLCKGIAYSGDCDLAHAGHYMSAWLALTRLYQGRWNEASEIALGLIAKPQLSAISRIMALVALGRVRARRGDPGAAAALDEALELALGTGTLQRLAPARAARAEAAMLAGDPGRARAEAMAVHELAVRHRHAWHVGELTFWRRQSGETIAVPRWAAQPFQQQIKGEWQGAAVVWEGLGCPYEQARALADGDAPAQLAALEIFDRLGAVPAAAALRQRMRGEGTRRIPRGPRATTRQNLFGLTQREMQILGCVADGLSNGGIGARLHISPKTVDHHVSSVLGKLGAASRGEAARIAGERRLLGALHAGTTQNREALGAK